MRIEYVESRTTLNPSGYVHVDGQPTLIRFRSNPSRRSPSMSLWIEGDVNTFALCHTDKECCAFIAAHAHRKA